MHIRWFHAALHDQAFELLTEFAVKYPSEAAAHAPALLDTCVGSYRRELSSDAPRVAALRCLRKVLRRLPSLDLGLSHRSLAGRPDAMDGAAGASMSVAKVWEALMSELRHGHPTRKSKSLGMVEALLKTLGLVAEAYANADNTWWADQLAKLQQVHPAPTHKCVYL